MGKVKIIDGKLVNYLPDKSYILKTKPHPLCSLKNNLAFWNHKKWFVNQETETKETSRETVETGGTCKHD